MIDTFGMCREECEVFNSLYSHQTKGDNSAELT